MAAIGLVSQIEQLADERAVLIRKFLRQHGWKSHCNSPGAFWLWEITLPDGRHFNCNEGTAFAIQRQMTCDECDKPHEECECKEECW